MDLRFIIPPPRRRSARSANYHPAKLAIRAQLFCGLFIQQMLPCCIGAWGDFYHNKCRKLQVWIWYFLYLSFKQNLVWSHRLSAAWKGFERTTQLVQSTSINTAKLTILPLARRTVNHESTFSHLSFADLWLSKAGRLNISQSFSIEHFSLGQKHVMPCLFTPFSGAQEQVLKCFQMPSGPFMTYVL